MRIAVSSGKGGTGKTTVATNLAFVAAGPARSVAYLDCDVEEPNGAIFLKPDFDGERPVEAVFPEVDSDLCTACGRCGEICQYSAIVLVNGTVLTFPELCHGCGGCGRVCPSGAITERTRAIGKLQFGRAGDIRFIQGLLDIGQAMSPPVIRAVKAAGLQADLVISDCPPGTSCPVIEAMRGNDYVLLVTEPTPFGLHDLKLAVETVRQLAIPFGVVINRSDSGDDQTHRFCRDSGIAVLSEIPDIRAVAEAYSRGILAAEASVAYRRGFQKLLERIDEEVGL
ncbi:MAG: ATP-binding protein [Phycisphaerae bacterium]